MLPSEVSSSTDQTEFVTVDAVPARPLHARTVCRLETAGRQAFVDAVDRGEIQRADLGSVVDRVVTEYHSDRMSRILP